MGSLISTLQQTFPGRPQFTDKDVPDMSNKITIVTGANTGLGKEVAQILYSKNAKVYMTARSERKTREAMESIQRASPTSSGELVFLHLDLTDLDSVKRSAKEFIQKENKLDILFNNAGVAYPGPLSHTKQGYELQLGTNCVGPFAFTKLLTPVLASTATDAPKGSVRVVWVSSSAIDAANPKDYVESLKRVDSMGGLELYGTSKLGNYLHAAEYARRYRSEGILSVSLNPGNLKTELLRAHEGKWIVSAINRILLYPSVYGAYTILFAGVSKQVNMGNTGSFVVPWGRIMTLSKGYRDAVKTKEEGGTGTAARFWDWSETQVKSYV